MLNVSLHNAIKDTTSNHQSSAPQPHHESHDNVPTHPVFLPQAVTYDCYDSPRLCMLSLCNMHYDNTSFSSACKSCSNMTAKTCSVLNTCACSHGHVAVCVSNLLWRTAIGIHRVFKGFIPPVPLQCEHIFMCIM